VSTIDLITVYNGMEELSELIVPLDMKFPNLKKKMDIHKKLNHM
jgi:hypothetical protein